MDFSIPVIVISIILVIVAVAEVFVFKKARKIEKYLVAREAEAEHKMYEATLLNELSDKMEYALGLQSAIEVIAGSLNGVIDYSVASYMLFSPEKIILKSYIFIFRLYIIFVYLIIILLKMLLLVI